MQEKIVGIGGFPRSGKDALAEIFLQAGYFGVSLGDIVRGITAERHKDKPDPISVANMTETSNWLRETRGPDVVLQELLKQYRESQAAGNTYKGLLAWSVRAPVEVDYILARGGQMIWVEASDVVRHERGMKHMRVGEAVISLEEFRRQELLQWKPQPGANAATQMNLSYVKERATVVFENNGTDLDEFRTRAYELLRSLE